MIPTMNFFWIGKKPLPINDELKILSTYASSGKLAVILWVDSPQKIISQLFEHNLQILLQKGKLEIRPVSMLFEEDEGQSELEKKCDKLLDALQSREQVGEGNIGTRVDILKIQTVYKIGGIVIDFDTAKSLLLDNKYQMSHVVTGLQSLLAKQRLLYNTNPPQLDFFVSEKRSADTQLLRETLITILKNNTEVPIQSDPEIKWREMGMCLFKSPFLSKSTAIYAEIKENQDKGERRKLWKTLPTQDIRRSHKGWLSQHIRKGHTHHQALSQVIVTSRDTGAIAVMFISMKVSKEDHNREITEEKMEFAQTEINRIKARLDFLKKQEKDFAKEPLSKRVYEAKKARLLSEKALWRDEIKELNSEEKARLTEYHSLQNAAHEANLVVPLCVYTDSWLSKERMSPIAYLEDETIYKKNRTKIK
jgi:hypothetical protein